MVDEKQKKEFQKYYYEKYGEAYDLNDPAFPVFYEIYETAKRKGVIIQTPEAAQAYQAEKNKATLLSVICMAAAVGLICATYYLTRPDLVYSNFIENSEVKYSSDGKTRYLKLEKSEDGGVIGRNFIEQENAILIPLTKGKK